MSIIEEIRLDEEVGFGHYESVDGETLRLTRLSKINLFVGENNSGKSRFIRHLAQIKALRFRVLTSQGALQGLRNEFYSILKTVYEKHEVFNIAGDLPALDSVPSYDNAVEGEAFYWPLLATLQRIMAATRDSFSYSSPQVHRALQLLFELKGNVEPLVGRLEELLRPIPKELAFDRIYIPTLRGLRRFEGLNDCYGVLTKLDYFDADERVAIFTGLTLYEDIKRLLLGTLAERKVVSDFQEFLSSAFFHGQPVALIPRYDSTALYVKIGRESEYPVHNLGDGIQSIIALTFPLFRRRSKRTLVFIEEPELNLHPGLQRLLLTVLSSTKGFELFQYSISTHSNHLLDLTLDFNRISVFTFRKQLNPSLNNESEAKFLVENVSNESEQTLQLLGVKSSSVFFANCTIWVEGITDRRYIARFIELYEDFLLRTAEETGTTLPERFKQDLHYSFVEYSGANITHWSFLDDVQDPLPVRRICARLFLISDHDDPKDAAKAERQERLRENLGENYYCLKCREIENLLSPEVLKRVITDYEGQEVVFPSFTEEDYKLVPLGAFIEGLVPENNRTRRGAYASRSGTVSDKLGFCQRSVRHLKSFAELSGEAKELTQRIYEFIGTHNS